MNIDRYINDFKQFIQEKYNKKYTEIAYDKIKSNGYKEYCHKLEELALLRDIVALSECTFDNIKENFKELYNNQIKIEKEKDALKAEITELKDKLEKISETNSKEIASKVENDSVHKKLTEKELETIIHDISYMKKATPSFLQGAMSLQNKEKYSPILDIITAGYSETFVNMYPESVYGISKYAVYNIISHALISGKIKVSTYLLNSQAIIDFCKNNGRNVETLLKMDKYVSNPAMLKMQNTLVQVKKYGAAILTASSINKRVFTERFFEHLYEDMRRQSMYIPSKNNNGSSYNTDNLLSHIYDSKHYPGEQAFLKKLILVDSVYADSIVNDNLVFSNNNIIFFPNKVNVEDIIDFVSFIHTVNMFLKNHGDILAKLLTDISDSEEVVRTHIDRAICIYESLDESIAKVVEEYEKNTGEKIK